MFDKSGNYDDNNEYDSSRESTTVWKRTLRSLPSWHFRQLWCPGLVSGGLLTMGMLGNIISVTHLGQGIGNSITQAKIIVGGLWGIFYFQEVRGIRILYWFGSALTTIVGIVWLSAERLAAKNHGPS